MTKRARDAAIFSNRRVSRDAFFGLGERPRGTIVSVVENPAPRGTVWVMWDDSNNVVQLWSLSVLRLENP